MSYVTVTYYKDTFKGVMESLDNEELQVKLDLASIDIDSLTYNRIIDFDGLTDFQKEKVRMAVCLHADFSYQYGSLFDSPLSGYSAGSVSVSFNNEAIADQNGITTSQRAFSILKQTGLAVRLFI